MVKFLKAFIPVFLTICLFTSCTKSPDTEKTPLNKERISQIVSEKSVDEAVEEIISGMTLEEKVYQMMFVTPEDITGVSVAVQAGEATKKAIEQYPVGGIIYFAQNFENREQTMKMIQNTQSYSKIPLFISVDEEGGSVSRLGRNSAMGTTLHPSMAEIGATNEPQNAYDTGTVLGAELKELCFNVDFAPVADILLSKDNVETGTRSFGSDKNVVSSMVSNLVSGLQDNGVSATLKHFPGAGATTTDSHNGFSENPRTIDELRETEFLPFKSGIDAGTDFVMVSHLTLTNATEEKLPSSLSKEVVTDMLKGELGFDGIIITDSFRMGAVADFYTPEEVGVMAVMAGNDMILMPKDLVKTHAAIIDAVKSGKISEERINESVRKILKMKIENGLWN